MLRFFFLFWTGITGNCCCDYRRAVIVLAIIDIVYYCVFAVLLGVGVGVGAYFAGQNINDDNVASSIQAGIGIIGGVIIAIYVVAALGGVFKLVAALKFNVCMLITSVVFDLIGFASAVYQATTPTPITYWDEYTGQWDTYEVPRTTGQIFGGVLIAIIFSGLIIYPTIGLIVEIKKGIMSKETYPREAYSCCCQPNV